MKVLSVGKSFALGIACLAVSAGVAMATPFFVETFTGPGTDNSGYVTNNAANHFGVIGGKYVITDDFGNPGTELRWNTGQPLGTFESHITVELSPFRVAPTATNDNTKTDFKYRFFGPDGFVEFVMNSFGDARLFHGNTASNDFGNLVPNTSIGYSDGDTLDLTLEYNSNLDKVKFFYEINGGGDIQFYSGLGNSGYFGNFAGSVVDFQLFKFSNSPTDQTFASVDYWDVVPEPATGAMLGIGALVMFYSRRRRR